MFDAMTFEEIDSHGVELLPARTVLSCFGGGVGYAYGYGCDGDSGPAGGGADGGQEGAGTQEGPGTQDSGGDSEANAAAVNYNDIDIYNQNSSGAVSGIIATLDGLLG